MLQMKPFDMAVSAYLLAATLAMGAIAAEDAEGAAPARDPLEVEFSRAFGVPADGSWDGLFSGDNVLDPVRYATQKPEQKV